jgi:hypothetical protein
MIVCSGRCVKLWYGSSYFDFPDSPLEVAQPTIYYSAFEGVEIDSAIEDFGIAVYTFKASF